MLRLLPIVFLMAWWFVPSFGLACSSNTTGICNNQPCTTCSNMNCVNVTNGVGVNPCPSPLNCSSLCAGNSAIGAYTYCNSHSGTVNYCDTTGTCNHTLTAQSESFCTSTPVVAQYKCPTQCVRRRSLYCVAGLSMPTFTNFCVTGLSCSGNCSDYIKGFVAGTGICQSFATSTVSGTCTQNGTANSAECIFYSRCVSNNVTGVTLHQCGSNDCIKPGSCTPGTLAASTQLSDICYLSQVVTNTSSCTTNCSNFYKGYNGTNCETFSGSVSSGVCDATGTCKPASTANGYWNSTCGTTPAQFYQSCDPACVNPATSCIPGTDPASVSPCYVGPVSSGCQALDCNGIIVGWNASSCIAYNSTFYGVCGSNGQCAVNNTEGSCSASNTTVLRTCLHSACKNNCTAGAVNSTSVFADICKVDEPGSGCPTALACSQLVSGWDSNFTTCQGYPSATNTKWCGSDSNCTSVASVSTCNAVQTYLAAPPASLGSCGSVGCIKPNSCVAGSAASSISASSLCYTDSISGQGLCTNSYVCGANGTCVAPPSMPPGFYNCSQPQPTQYSACYNSSWQIPSNDLQSSSTLIVSSPVVFVMNSGTINVTSFSFNISSSGSSGSVTIDGCAQFEPATTVTLVLEELPPSGTEYVIFQSSCDFDSSSLTFDVDSSAIANASCYNIYAAKEFTPTIATIRLDITPNGNCAAPVVPTTPSSSPIPSSPDNNNLGVPTTGSNNAVIIGSVVGVVVGALAIAGAIILIVFMRRRVQKLKHERGQLKTVLRNSTKALREQKQQINKADNNTGNKTEMFTFDDVEPSKGH